MKAYVIVIAAALSAASALAARYGPEAQQRAADAATDAALASAKAALIGYATTTPLTGSGPGNLLCPDLNDDGISYSTGSGCSGPTAQAARLGRLPWRTLGLPDPRDGSGQRLWYAVSDNVRSFQAPGSTNSETLGTITVRDSNHRVLYDATTGGGVVAVIIAPGPPLTRANSLTDPTPRPQKRSTLDPRDYLDATITEDNADFTDGTTNGFIMGPVRAADGRVIVNDRAIVITRDELLAATEKRLAAEVRNCLVKWAEANNDTFPAPAPLDSNDQIGTPGSLFGRLPLTQYRNLGDSLTAARAGLDAAVTALTNRTAQTQRAAIEAAIRATRSLAQTAELIDQLARPLLTAPAATLKTALDDAGLDPYATQLRQHTRTLSVQLANATTDVATIKATAGNLTNLLGETRTPNTALQQAAQQARDHAIAAQSAASGQERANAQVLLNSANTLLGALNTQRIDTPAAVLRLRAGSLNTARQLATSGTLASAATDLIATLQALPRPTPKLAVATDQALSLATATLTAAQANNPALAATTAAASLTATETLAQTIDAHGDNLTTSALAAGTASTASIQSYLGQLTQATSATSATSNAALSLAERMLSHSNQTRSNFNELLLRASAASQAAAAIALDTKTGKTPVRWPDGTPSCTWLNPGGIHGWARSEWSRFFYYQTDSPKLKRTPTGELATGNLILNGRPGPQLVVISPGRALENQSRQLPHAGALFEGANNHPSRSGGATAPTTQFEQRLPGAQFNDQLAY